MCIYYYHVYIYYLHIICICISVFDSGENLNEEHSLVEISQLPDQGLILLGQSA